MDWKRGLNESANIAICVQACGVRFQNVRFTFQNVRLPFQNARLPFQNVLFFHVTSCLGDEIDMFSRLKRNVWLLYAIFTV